MTRHHELHHASQPTENACRSWNNIVK